MQIMRRHQEAPLVDDVEVLNPLHNGCAIATTEACPACTFKNRIGASKCAICGVALGCAYLKCQRCTYDNKPDAVACDMCGANIVPCPRCTYINTLESKICAMCGSPWRN